jgi:hypothetical protein
MGQLVVVDALVLLNHYHDLFRLDKIFIPNAVVQRIGNKARVDIERIGIPIDEEERKRHMKLYRNHHVMGFFNDSKEKYEIIGSAGTGWVKKIQPLADYFQTKSGLSFFEDQKRIAAALLVLQEMHPLEKIIFLSADNLLKEFVEAVFMEFPPDNLLECYNAKDELPKILRICTPRLKNKKTKKKFEPACA